MESELEGTGRDGTHRINSPLLPALPPLRWFVGRRAEAERSVLAHVCASGGVGGMCSGARQRGEVRRLAVGSGGVREEEEGQG
jgi:hypothetical protein